MAKKNLLDEAFSQWKLFLSDDQIQKDCSGRSSDNGFYIELFLESKEQIVEVLKIASLYKIPVYPTSTGRNWAYSDSSHLKRDCVFLNLSRMNKIINFDLELGIVTIEPGVTQDDLFLYLSKSNLPYLAPVNGSHKDSSVIGSLLERGHGISQYLDVFNSLVSLEVILADGTYYKKPDSYISSYSKWGVGPYVDGLFSQSNFGVVTEAAILLAPKPEIMEVFSFGFGNEKMGSVLNCLNHLMKRFPQTISYFSVQNNRKFITKIIPYPKENINEAGYIDDKFIQNICLREKISDWEVAGIVQGQGVFVEYAKKVIKKVFSNEKVKVSFLSKEEIVLLRKVKKTRKLEILQKCLTNSLGHPVVTSPVIAFWKYISNFSEEKFNSFLFSDVNPQKDKNSGIYFFTSMIPVKFSTASFFPVVEMVCKRNGFDPIMSFTNFNYPSLYFTVQIFFDKDNLEERERASRCYRELSDSGDRFGFPIYRAHSDFMDSVVDKNDPFWQTAEKIKKALDPDNIISPGRYSSYIREEN